MTTTILRTSISNYLVNNDLKNTIEDILDRVRINYYNYSRFAELLLNKLIQKNQISDFEIDQDFFSKCLQYSSYKTKEFTKLEEGLVFSRIDTLEKQDIIINELKNKLDVLIESSDYQKFYDDNKKVFTNKDYKKYKKCIKKKENISSEILILSETNNWNKLLE